MKRAFLFLALLLMIFVISVVRGQTTKKGAAPAQTKTSTATSQPTVPAKPAVPAGVTPEPHRSSDSIVEHLQSGMILDYATFLVAGITVIFAICASFLGIFEWKRMAELKREVAAERKSLDDERRTLDAQIEMSRTEVQDQKQRLRAELDEGKKAIDARIDAFNALIETMKSALQAQEQRVQKNQRFLEAVLTHHSNLLVGIVRGFESALNADEVMRLNSLISETESVLDLFRPDKTVVRRALLNLEHIGSDVCVSPLVELRDDPNEDRQISIGAQKVLMKVRARLRSEYAP